MKKFFARLTLYADRPWYYPLICILAFIDLFVMFIPTEGMIITTSLVRPKRWIITALIVTTASSLGAFTLAWCGYHYGEPFVTWILGDQFFKSAMWIRMDGWISHYGFWALWFIALGPLPQQPAILICALGHMSPPEIMLAVWTGRVPKYLLFSYLATHGPRWFKHAFGDEHLDVEFTWTNIRRILKSYLNKD